MTLALPKPPLWTEHAVCVSNPDDFFPGKNESSTPAKDVCRRCPVALPCLRYALDNEEPHGIWGATTPDERKRLKAGAA